MWLWAILSIDLLFCRYLLAVDQENSKPPVNSYAPSEREAMRIKKELHRSLKVKKLTEKLKPGQDFKLADFEKYRDSSLDYCSTVFELGEASLIAEIVGWYEKQSIKPLCQLGKNPVADLYSSHSFDAEIWALVQGINQRSEEALWKFEQILTLSNLFKVDHRLESETLGFLIDFWKQLSPEDKVSKWSALPRNGKIYLFNEAELLENSEINQEIINLKEELRREERVRQANNKKRRLYAGEALEDEAPVAKSKTDPSERSVV
jgi:hypothetical protein